MQRGNNCAANVFSLFVRKFELSKHLTQRGAEVVNSVEDYCDVSHSEYEKRGPQNILRDVGKIKPEIHKSASENYKSALRKLFKPSMTIKAFPLYKGNVPDWFTNEEPVKRDGLVYTREDLFKDNPERFYLNIDGVLKKGGKGIITFDMTDNEERTSTAQRQGLSSHALMYYNGLVYDPNGSFTELPRSDNDNIFKNIETQWFGQEAGRSWVRGEIQSITYFRLTEKEVPITPNYKERKKLVNRLINDLPAEKFVQRGFGKQLVFEPYIIVQRKKPTKPKKLNKKEQATIKKYQKQIDLYNAGELRHTRDNNARIQKYRTYIKTKLGELPRAG